MSSVSQVQLTSSTENNHHYLKHLDFFLRLSVIPFSVASIWVTATTKQDNSTYGNLEFNNIIGLKYLICINAISASYALVAIICSWFKFLLTKAWIFFISDQIVAYLVVTSGSSVIEILYLAYNGDKEVSWSEACSSYGKFCSRVKVALILHVFTFLCFLILSAISAFRVFSKFDPPSIPSKGVENDGES
ncbi:CASP-like protein 2D1 [Papaver somniferum]|uniref:CASP-like protein 2D1 n=1 Tax=Papaver somniferum TaxID=3469 RepID=UPI000E6F4D92|nr:CASP-like protein 2D1 [Papaver somniferum]